MFVSYGPSLPDQHQLITQVLNLAHNNYTELLRYFSPSTISQFNSFHHCQQVSQFVSVPVEMLHELYGYLQSSAQILETKFSSILANGQKTEYDWLRSVWDKHYDRRNNQSVQDKLDSLNQSISMLKLKARQSFQQQVEQNQKIWESQYKISAEDNIWSHPMFEIMNQKINGLSMRCSDLENKNEDYRQQTLVLNKKHQDTQSKIGIYKQKVKKMQKQMFEMAKKKAEVEKLILQKEQTKILKNQNERMSFASIADKQNPIDMTKKHSQYILLLEEETRDQRTSLEPSLMNSANIREKFRHAKNISRRTTSMISPNASLDSIKSLKFERTGGKKLIIKGS